MLDRFKNCPADAEKRIWPVPAGNADELLKLLTTESAENAEKKPIKEKQNYKL